MTTALTTQADQGHDMRLPVPMDADRMRAYLALISDENTLKLHNQLAAAYDKACKALIGPNDVQVEGKREFKKKSAWRKLQRYFNISTAVLSNEYEFRLNGSGKPVLIATCIVRGTSPWGQQVDGVGACATDEEIGNRKITIADAISTAETRATNRAISNLIAMGEVSAEEASREDRAKAMQDAINEMTLDEAALVPFPWRKPEKYSGKPLGALSINMLRSVADAIDGEIEKSGETEKRLTLRRATELLVADFEKRWSPEMRAVVDEIRHRWQDNEFFSKKDREELQKRIDSSDGVETLEAVLSDVMKILGLDEDEQRQSPTTSDPTTSTDPAPTETSGTSTTDGAATDAEE
jgi:hypothetical protein